jgi:hypothetical protein
VGSDHSLIELPLSTAYTGYLRQYGEGLHRMTRRWGKAGGALSRAGLFRRVPLTPEDISAKDCIAAIDSLIEEDVPVLSFSFHSPTLEPGHTMYVRTAVDLDAFYRWWDVVLDHLVRRSVTPMGLSEFLDAARVGFPREASCQAA